MKKGFTLLELSIVLVIIGVVTGSGLVTFAAYTQKSRNDVTLAEMAAIDKALLDFTVAFGRIPCPADMTYTASNANYGIEAATPGACTGGTPAANFSASGVVEGAVPTRALRLPDSYMLDGWGNHFRYAVDTSATSSGALPPPVQGACTSNPIRVNDASGAARTAKAIYALISHGPDGHGSYNGNGKIVNAASVNTDELTNCHCTTAGAAGTYAPTYVKKNPTANASNAHDVFDDLVSFREAWQMQAPNAPLQAINCPTQYLYVADYSNSRVLVFDKSGNYLAKLTSWNTGSGTTTFNANGPTSIAFDKNGNMWVTDFGNNRVIEFSSTGAYIRTIPPSCANAGCSASGNQQLFSSPIGIAIDNNNNVWVSEYNNNRVQEFSNSGTFIQQIPTGCSNSSVPACSADGSASVQGTGAGFYNLGYLTVDSNNQLWAVDFTGVRVERYDLTTTPATYKTSIGTGTHNTNYTCPLAAGNFEYAQTPAIDASGNLWVTQATNGSSCGCNIQKFINIDTALPPPYSATIGSCSNYDNLTGLAIDAKGNFWFSDYTVNKIYEYNPTTSTQVLSFSTFTGTTPTTFSGVRGLAFSSVSTAAR